MTRKSGRVVFNLKVNEQLKNEVKSKVKKAKNLFISEVVEAGMIKVKDLSEEQIKKIVSKYQRSVAA